VSAVPPLGVGVGFQRSLAPFLLERAHAYDYLEVVPDVVWVDRGQGTADRYRDDDEAVAVIEHVAAAGKPVIPHSIGLSIGSAHVFDREHLAQISGWCERFGSPWHSDHLSYSRAEHGESESGEMNAGMNMPLAHDEEMLDLLVPRVREVLAGNPRPFALENNVYYLQLADPQYDEPAFLNELSARSGCRLLLDLHNIYVNERNGGMAARAFLEQLDLSRVIEIHVAGGNEWEGFYLDSHSGPTPEAVIELLAWALPRCPNLGGVTYELVGSWFDEMGPDALEAELGRLRDLWRSERSPALLAR
jgi:uncharacterized protein (UPF0276 family)